MPGPLEQRPCGETLRGCHPAHTYMQNACVYQCPGGDMLPPGSVRFADVQATLDAVWQQGDHLADNLRYAVMLPDSPCPVWSLQEPHDAHDFASPTGPARCPGWSEPDDGPGPQPGEPPTDAERIRDLEYILQRAREALGTETPAPGCDGHEARITALESALRDVLAHAEPHTQHCLQVGALDINTVRRWHAVLRGEAAS